MPGPMTDCCIYRPDAGFAYRVDCNGHLALQGTNELGASDDGRVGRAIATHEDDGGREGV